MSFKIFLEHKIILLSLLFLSCGCNEDNNIIEALIITNVDKLGPPAKDPNHFQVQVIYTQIDRDSLNNPFFRSYHYHVDSTNYFYPASTVKMPAAFTALEKINSIDQVTVDHFMLVDSMRTPKQAIALDSNGMAPTVREYIERIFLVSDNNAFNRIYEFTGQDYLNQTLFDKGFHSVRIIHRLSAPAYNYQDNQYTNAIHFLNGPDTIFSQKEIKSQYQRKHPYLKNQIRGKGFINHTGSLILEPFDFTYKNYISLQDLHDLLAVILFPVHQPEGKSFNFSDENYRFLYKSMSQLPRESQYKEYHDSIFGDHYTKYLMFGDQAIDEIPPYIKIFNKIGCAYGTLTDVAYIIDTKNQIEFILAATLLVNENGIYNDGDYEYDQIGLPFLGSLGRIFYDYEISRPRAYYPNLSRFIE